MVCTNSEVLNRDCKIDTLHPLNPLYKEITFHFDTYGVHKAKNRQISTELLRNSCQNEKSKIIEYFIFLKA